MERTSEPGTLQGEAVWAPGTVALETSKGIWTALEAPIAE